MFCSKCGSELPRNAQFCVNCGDKVLTSAPAKNTSKKSGCLKWLLIPIGLFFALILLALIGAMFNDTPKAESESTLDQETEIVEESASRPDTPPNKGPAAEPAQESEVEADPELETETTIEETQEIEIEIPLGETKDNPIVITADTLVKEINSNIDSAKAKYNGKWIQITGSIVNHYTVAGMTGYYLYGDRGTSGLRIICWCDGDPYKDATQGNTYTFLGIMREVTLFNATEIGECEIIID